MANQQQSLDFFRNISNLFDIVAHGVEVALFGGHHNLDHHPLIYEVDGQAGLLITDKDITKEKDTPKKIRRIDPDLPVDFSAPDLRVDSFSAYLWRDKIKFERGNYVRCTKIRLSPLQNNKKNWEYKCTVDKFCEHFHISYPVSLILKDQHPGEIDRKKRILMEKCRVMTDENFRSLYRALIDEHKESSESLFKSLLKNDIPEVMAKDVVVSSKMFPDEKKGVNMSVWKTLVINPHNKMIKELEKMDQKNEKTKMVVRLLFAYAVLTSEISLNDQYRKAIAELHRLVLRELMMGNPNKVQSSERKKPNAT